MHRARQGLKPVIFLRLYGTISLRSPMPEGIGWVVPVLETPGGSAGDPYCREPNRSAPEARQEGSPGRKPWVRCKNGFQPRRGDTNSMAYARRETLVPRLRRLSSLSNHSQRVSAGN